MDKSFADHFSDNSPDTLWGTDDTPDINPMALTTTEGDTSEEDDSDLAEHSKPPQPKPEAVARRRGRGNLRRQSVKEPRGSHIRAKRRANMSGGSGYHMDPPRRRSSRNPSKGFLPSTQQLPPFSGTQSGNVTLEGPQTREETPLDLYVDDDYPSDLSDRATGETPERPPPQNFCPYCGSELRDRD